MKNFVPCLIEVVAVVALAAAVALLLVVTLPETAVVLK